MLTEGSDSVFSFTVLVHILHHLHPFTSVTVRTDSTAQDMIKSSRPQELGVFCLPTQDKRNQSDLYRSGYKLSAVVKNLWCATIINPNGVPISRVNSWPFKATEKPLIVLHPNLSAVATPTIMKCIGHIYALECSRRMLWVSSVSGTAATTSSNSSFSMTPLAQIRTSLPFLCTNDW